tara:strand:- start:420 stop:737 length:318 start_codon:yes stop_codon:yes gene_type:complete
MTISSDIIKSAMKINRPQPRAVKNPKVLGSLDHITRPHTIKQSGLYKLKKGEKVHPSKSTRGSPSKTMKGKKDYTTKKTSKDFHERTKKSKEQKKSRRPYHKKKK